MKNIQVNIVTNSEQIVSVIHSAFKRYETDSMPSSALNETSATIDSELQQGIIILGAYMELQLVGVVKIQVNKSDCYFSRLAVLPSFQGKGVGSCLVRGMETIVTEKQVTIIHCKVRKSEINNILFYQKMGYKIIEEQLTTSTTGSIILTVLLEKVVRTCM